MSVVSHAICNFLSTEFTQDRGDFEITPESNLIDQGVIDSLGIFVLIGFIEAEFGVGIDPEDVVLDNFESLGAITDFVLRKQEQETAARSDAS